MNIQPDKVNAAAGVTLSVILLTRREWNVVLKSSLSYALGLLSVNPELILTPSQKFTAECMS